MLIKLKGDLDQELTAIGLKAGDEITAYPDNVGKAGAMYFIKMYRGFTHDCVVWPENYEIIRKN